MPASTSSGSTSAVRCAACGVEFALEEFRWRCDCGGPLDLETPSGDPTPPPDAPWSLWRYRAALPPLAQRGASAVTMGEGMTPLVPLQTGGASRAGVLGKLDFVMPTLSFKDRGAAVLMSSAAAAGVRWVVADSSGNAGASIAAYAARAGIGAEVFVPEAAPVGKLEGIRRFGATLRTVPGNRQAAAEAAIRRVAETGWVYASHAWQPLFIQGTKTVAFEIWEQLGRRAPHTVVVPVGNGTLLLGAALGFSELRAAGLADRVPVLVAVQAERCAPLLRTEPCGPTVAAGIAVGPPPRKEQILEAVSRTGGIVITAAEEGIEPARRRLAAAGIDVEPTAAATWAAWTAWPGARAGQDAGGVVVMLTGAGPKGGSTP